MQWEVRRQAMMAMGLAFKKALIAVSSLEVFAESEPLVRQYRRFAWIRDELLARHYMPSVEDRYRMNFQIFFFILFEF